MVITMTAILLSIQPCYVQRIFCGEKRFEYRKRIPEKPIDRILIYETFPTKAVVGEVEVLGVLSNAPKLLWAETNVGAGISKKKFMEYFANRKIGYAFQLGKVTIYPKPRKATSYGLKKAPQNFAYIKHKAVKNEIIP